MQATKRKLTPQELRKLEQIQQAALELARDYLDKPVKAMSADGYKATEIACAFIGFGYHLLRDHLSEKSALAMFNLLAQFTRQRNEEGRRQRRKTLN